MRISALRAFGSVAAAPTDSVRLAANSAGNATCAPPLPKSLPLRASHLSKATLGLRYKLVTSDSTGDAPTFAAANGRKARGERIGELAMARNMTSWLALRRQTQVICRSASLRITASPNASR